jgi:uncharacterized protein YhaN
MRIDRLDLMAYGPFTKKSLDLSNGDAGLHLIYGDNEAGKSTSLRALIAFLFGIPKSTSDSYLHSYEQLRIGGRLRLSGGKEIDFVRRKGTKGTLLKPDTDMAMDDAALFPFLPRDMDETLFKQLYGIDHSRLIDGGKELLKQSGDIGQALFSAAVGTENLRKVLSDLQSSAEELFTPQSSKKRVNQTISHFKEAQKRVKDASLPVAEWKRLQKEREDAVFSVRQIEANIDAGSKEKSRLNRVNRVKGALAERRNIVAQIEAMGDVLLLPEEFDEKRKDATNNLQKAAHAKERAEAKFSHLKEESALLDVRNELLDNEEAILVLYKELGAVETANKDRPKHDGTRHQLQSEAEQLLKGVRPDLGIDDANPLRPLTHKKKWIASLAEKHRFLTREKEKAEAGLRDTEDKQEAIKKELGKQAQSNFDLSELKAAVSAARKSGNLEQRLADLQKRASDSNATCEHDLVRLGRFSGTLEALSKVAMPVSETLDAFEKKLDEMSEKNKEYVRRQKELKEEQRQAEQDLKALLSTGNVPTLSELEEARTERNTGWNLIKRKYIEATDVKKEIAVFAPDSDLPKLYEQKVDIADRVSDRLRSAADQVVKRANLEATIEGVKSRLTDMTEEIRKTDQDRETHQKKWHSLWEPLGIDSGTPKEMKEWLGRVDKLLSNVQTAHTVSGDARKLAEDCKALKESVSLQILKFDHAIDLIKMSLEAMINLCEQRIEREEAALTRKRQLELSLDDTEMRIKRGCEELKAIESDRALWAKEWDQAIEGLGLGVNVHPEQAVETIERLLEFFNKFDESEKFGRRIYGIDQVVEEFKKKTFAFADSIRFKRDGQEAMTVAAWLNRDLMKAREAQASLKKIITHEKEIKGEMEEADITIQTAREQLAVLRSKAAVETDNALEAAGESSQKMRGLRQTLVTLEQELTRNGDGLNIQQLEKEAGELDVDAIEGALTKVSTELKALNDNRDRLRDQLQTLQNDIKTKDGSAAAATASEEAEQHLATLVSGAEQYLRLKIAALILQQQIEGYRKVNQAPVLARAGELFSRLTQRSYTNLRDELDESGKPILVGVRCNNKEVYVDRMSDGARDQLYLSLRLATLEQHLCKGEPMPFIVDDILISFDDDRTKASLDVLAELSGRTQVLLFTHHKRVIELASALPAKAGIFIHELV